MATVAIGRRVRVLSVNMTLHTGHRRVTTRQREPRQIMIIRRRTPARRGVALRAHVIKITRLVRRVLRVMVIHLMAAVAVRRHI